MDQETPDLFKEILHPIAEYECHLFNNIISKLLADGDDYGFMECFIRTASKHLFNRYVDGGNTISFESDISKLDIWRLLHMLDSNHVFDEYFEDISYEADTNQFCILTSIPSEGLNIHCKEEEFLDWSEIPRYLIFMHVTYVWCTHHIVDLSDFDQLCHLQSLTITMLNATIIFPDYSLPKNLQKIRLSNLHSVIDYRALWKVGSNIRELEINSKRMNKTDFIGI